MTIGFPCVAAGLSIMAVPALGVLFSRLRLAAAARGATRDGRTVRDDADRSEPRAAVVGVAARRIALRTAGRTGVIVGMRDKG